METVLPLTTSQGIEEKPSGCKETPRLEDFLSLHQQICLPGSSLL